jgi:hypothetical protein
MFHALITHARIAFKHELSKGKRGKMRIFARPQASATYGEVINDKLSQPSHRKLEKSVGLTI